MDASVLVSVYHVPDAFHAASASWLQQHLRSGAIIVAPLLYPRPYSELTELFVDLAFRRQGIATALLRHAEQMARTAGSTQLILLTGLTTT